MTLGKILRKRRLRAQGRAAVGWLESFGLSSSDGAAAATRAFVRGGLDAIAVSPGVLEQIAESLDSLAPIVRLNLSSPQSPRTVSLRAALEMGAEAVVLTVNAGSARDLESLGQATEDARRCGLPIVAEMLGEDLRYLVLLAEEFGVDIVQLRAGASDLNNLGMAVKAAYCPVFIRPSSIGGAALVRLAHGMLDLGVEGIVLDPQPESTLWAVHSLCHQGANLSEVLATV